MRVFNEVFSFTSPKEDIGWTRVTGPIYWTQQKMEIFPQWLTIFTLFFTLSLPWMYVMLSSFRRRASTFLMNACSLLSSALMRGIPGGFHLVSSHRSPAYLHRCHSRPAIFSACENACLCIRLCHRVTLCASGLPLLCRLITLYRGPLKLSAGQPWLFCASAQILSCDKSPWLAPIRAFPFWMCTSTFVGSPGW